MRKVTDLIVKGRYIFLIVFILLAGLGLYLDTKVNINDDIMKYLPATSETKIGYDIMNEEFAEQDSSSLNVMFKDLSEKEKESTLKELESIEGVSKVEYENTLDYNKDNYTLYVVNVDDYASSETSTKVFEYINENLKPAGMSGSIYDNNKTILKISVVIIAIVGAMIILVILSESYLEPFLYLFAIGIAVFINKGSNIMFESVSEITNSIVAILQLALSMDYSIMLSNRFKQEKQTHKNNIEAMKEALYQSFKSISSSSVTTIVGLLALVFMSFTIGKDLGIVLAKGVLLSLVSIFFCLPALLLMFDKIISNSKKKSINFNLKHIAKFSYASRFFQLVAVIVLFIVAYILKGNITITYTGSEQNVVGSVFPQNNQIAIVYENKYEELMTKYCRELESDKNIDKTLCYSNTINQKLAYDELNNKFDELGQDTELEDYLIKLIYYNYYNKDSNNKMTLNQFISFIKSDIYTNEDFKDKIDQDTKDNLDLLTNFTDKDKINKKRTSKEIADLLNMDEKDAEKIMIYYVSENVDTKMTIDEFINFMLNDVSKDPEYSKQVDKSTLNKLKQLKNFSDKSMINKKMNSKELSKIFGIDESLIEQLFLFYNVNKESTISLTINEFTSTALAMSKEESYKSMFDQETIKSLTLLNTLSNDSVVNNKLDISTMKSNLQALGLSLDDSTLASLYILYDGSTTDTKLTLNQFANTAIYMSNDPSYSSYFDQTTLQSLNTITTLNNYYNTTLPNNKLYQMFGITDPTLQGKLNYAITGNPAGAFNLTPVQFVSTLLSNELIKSNLSTTEINSLSLAKYIMDNVDTEYTKEEIASILNKDQTTINIIFGVYNYGANIGYQKVSVKELISFIYTIKDNALVSSKISGKEQLLTLAYTIVNNTNTKYTYNNLSNLIGVDAKTVNQIYGVYTYKLGNTTLTEYELTKLILDNKSNPLLKDKLDLKSLVTLNLVKEVMDSTINNTKYNAKKLSTLMGVDKGTMSLLFGLYDTRKTTETASLKNYVDFIIKKVMNNKDYSSKFDKETKSKLTTIQSVMNKSLKGEKYTTAEAFVALDKLSDDLDKSLVDLVYMYYGSTKNFDKSWTMTIEEFVTYINDDILNDDRFKDFIQTDMRNKITDANKTITKSKDLIVSKKYSRVVLNTMYSPEGKDTYKFINKLNKDLDKDGIYVVGNSPMAVEMSKTFNDELDKITILTMIFIFVVVAITFKDLIIPVVLVLIIQCAVYVTMSAISISGGSVYFIALLIVQAILMGATIDYAIVYTSYYRESRLTMSVKDSILNAYNRSIHTILSSSLILIIVTLVVANFASAIAAKICETISEGTFAAVLLIVFVLPGVLAAADKLICRKGYYKEIKTNKKHSK